MIYESNDIDQDYTDIWTKDEYIYVHYWKVNDLVLWNNYTVAHKRQESRTHSREFLKQGFSNENKIFGYRRLK